MRGFVRMFIVATAIALAVRLFVVEDYRIVSDSMAPGLLGGDLVFVSKSAFNLRLPFSTYELARLRTPRRGEVVAFTLPDRGGQTFVKRVVALEGDKVSMRENRLEVNGVFAGYRTEADALLETNADGVTYPVAGGKATAKDYGPVEIPAGHFFALGDNRADSVDSRSWGPVPLSCLKGRVALVWLSLDDAGHLRRGRAGLWVHGGLFADRSLR